MEPTTVGTFEELVELEPVESTPDRVVLRCPITPRLHQPYGIVHGGVYCSIVQIAATTAATAWLGATDVVCVNNSTNFIRATREGTLTATATPLQRGRRQQLWQVAIVDDTDRLVAHGQVRLVNIRDDRLDAPPS